MATEQSKVRIPPNNLNIVWGNDSRYWRLPSKEDEPAELVQVCWLEVTGSCSVKKSKTYEVGFKVSMTPDAFGWTGCPVYIMAKIGKKGKYTLRRAALEKFGGQEVNIPEQPLTITVPPQGEETLYFGMYEVWSGKWKGGLKIHEAFVNEK